MDIQGRRRLGTLAVLRIQIRSIMPDVADNRPHCEHAYYIPECEGVECRVTATRLAMIDSESAPTPNTDRPDGAVGDIKAVHDFAVEQMCLVDHGNDRCGNDDPRLCSISEVYLDLERLLTEAVKAGDRVMKAIGWVKIAQDAGDDISLDMAEDELKAASVEFRAVLTKAEEQGL